MSDTTTPRFLSPRRGNRTIEDADWIRAFLRDAPHAVICGVDDGQPYAVPDLFYFDAGRHCLYFHTRAGGRLHQTFSRERRACFVAFSMGRLLPAGKVTDYSTEYASVMAFGPVSLVDSPDEVRAALQWQLDKYFPHKRPGRDYVPFTDEEAARTTVYRLEIDSWSAKQNQAAPDHPGAFAHPYGG